MITKLTSSHLSRALRKAIGLRLEWCRESGLCRVSVKMGKGVSIATEGRPVVLKDGFAKELSSGLVQLFTQNSGNMNPDPWYSALHFSHPTMIERIEALERSDKLTRKAQQ
jgi:hypothetical protein